jgi:hypothetical protein
MKLKTWKAERYDTTPEVENATILKDAVECESECGGASWNPNAEELVEVRQVAG